MENSEKVDQFAKFFSNKVINELNDEISKISFAKFLEKKASSVTNEKKETVYGGIVLNIMFAIECVLKFENSEKGLKNIKEIIEKLENKKSETDKMFSSVIETEVGMSLSCENCLAIFATDCFHSFIDLLEMETKFNLKETISEMLSGIIVSILKTCNDALIIDLLKKTGPLSDFLARRIMLN